MRNIAAKVATDNTMPGRLEAIVKFLLEILGHVALKFKAIKGCQGELDGFALHVVGHVGGFDDYARLTDGRRDTRGAVSGGA